MEIKIRPMTMKDYDEVYVDDHKRIWNPKH